MCPQQCLHLHRLALILIGLCVAVSSGSPFVSRPFRSWRGLWKPSPVIKNKKKNWNWNLIARCGAAKIADKENRDQNDIIRDSTHDKDDERYSRQVYTLGARAHRLVLSSTIYVDGPGTSGLVYECVKNLALSGAGNIILWDSSSSSSSSLDESYHDKSLDDLGIAYCRAAREELNLPNDKESPPEQVLEEYIRRLNPSVHVTKTERPLTITRPRDDNNIGDSPSRGVILCIDRPFQTQDLLNKLARKHNLAFVSVETAGVYGRVFCDFGPNFEVYDSDGETPLVTPLDRMELLTKDDNDEGGTIMVHAIDTEKHDVSKGDKIQFQMNNGDMIPELCTVVKVLTPQKIKVKCDSFESTSTGLEDFVALVNDKASSFSRVKVPTSVSFIPLEEALEAATIDGELFTPCDFDKSFDENRRSSILSCFQALSSFVDNHQSLPSVADIGKFQEMLATCRGDGIDNVDDPNMQQQSKHIQNFVSCCAAKLAPLQAMFGAIGAQEALKAATGLYNPVKQILLYDCDELLAGAHAESVEKSSGLAYILGQSLETKVKNAKLFVVGAGAIGCELLKNLAAMGFGTGKNGCISLTDMDTIEKSNLSRQLLFRDSDIGEFKSLAAQAAVHRFNPAILVYAYTSKVGGEDPGPFDEIFWSSGVDVVLSALDNMEARLFMDQQCVVNKKALVDAGTLGSKGNVQVVVPYQSESYGSSVDPPEPAIPVCTLKNFPYAISHTIQWGRDLFDGLYQRRPRQANDLAPSLSDGTNSLAQTLIRDMGDVASIEAAIELAEDLSFVKFDDLNSARKSALEWAAELATRLFYDAIVNLLREHPVDSVDEEGEPFWTGSRKVPKPVRFSSSPTRDSATDAANENLIQFVQSASRLRIEMFFGSHAQSDISADEARQALLEIQATKEGSGTLSRKPEEVETSTEAKLVAKLETIPGGVYSAALLTAEFEKDVESNGHVQFVNAASNLRAICYGIPPVNAMETRRVAGKIVPAMITTTAVVSALCCVELLKLLQKAPLSKHRNAFINLALPFFAFTVPVPADEIPGPDGKTFTVWDSIVIKEKKKSADSKGLTLKRFISKLKKAISKSPENIEVSTVSAGQYMIYASFLHEGDKDMMNRSIWDLVQEAMNEEEEFTGRSGSNEAEGNTVSMEDSLELTVAVEDTSTGEEFELPPIRVLKSQLNIEV